MTNLINTNIERAADGTYEVEVTVMVQGEVKVRKTYRDIDTKQEAQAMAESAEFMFSKTRFN